MHTDQFKKALEAGSLQELKQVPFSDLHCHADLAFSQASFQRITGKTAAPPISKVNGLSQFFSYYKENFSATVRKHHLELLKAAVMDSYESGVRLLQMSLNVAVRYLRPIDTLVQIARELKSIAPADLQLLLAIGINRPLQHDFAPYREVIQHCIDSGLFDAMDLYGQEDFSSLSIVESLFLRSRDAGLINTAHAGEFSHPDTIQKSVECLHLHQIQHGITAANSPAVMKFLSKHNIQLNLCPTSNLKLGAVATLAAYPARKLFDHGVLLTLNTDDLLAFNSTVPEEFLRLYQAGLFNTDELDLIRMQGLQNSKLST